MKKGSRADNKNEDLQEKGDKEKKKGRDGQMAEREGSLRG